MRHLRFSSYPVTLLIYYGKSCLTWFKNWFGIVKSSAVFDNLTEDLSKSLGLKIDNVDDSRNPQDVNPFWFFSLTPM